MTHSQTLLLFSLTNNKYTKFLTTNKEGTLNRTLLSMKHATHDCIDVSHISIEAERSKSRPIFDVHFTKA